MLKKKKKLSIQASTTEEKNKLPTINFLNRDAEE